MPLPGSFNQRFNTEYDPRVDCWNSGTVEGGRKIEEKKSSPVEGCRWTLLFFGALRSPFRQMTNVIAVSSGNVGDTDRKL